MNEKELRNLLLSQPLPDEHIAEERSWDVLRAAFVAREPVAHGRRVPRRFLVALAAIAAVVALSLTGPGGSAVDWIRDKVGRERVVAGPPGGPATTGLPTAGRLLVVSPKGVWVLAQGGAHRLLGRYTGGAWSPSGLFVALWHEGELAAVDPNAPADGLHWKLAGERILGARWSPDGFRLVYLSGDALRVVVENGTGDKELAGPVAAVLPAWKPGGEHVLAYADPDGRVIVVEADSGKKLWRTARAPLPIALAWTGDGKELVVVGEHRLRVFKAKRQLVRVLNVPSGLEATTAAVRPGTAEVAYTVRSRRSGQTTVLLYNGRFTRPLFSGPGEIRELVWSPDGRYLLVPWRAADEWLFLPVQGGRVLARPAVAEEFGAPRASGFAGVEGWCCANSAG